MFQEHIPRGKLGRTELNIAIQTILRSTWSRLSNDEPPEAVHPCVTKTLKDLEQLSESSITMITRINEILKA